MITIQNTIERLLNLFNRNCLLLKKELARLPKGSLHIKGKGSRTFYYHYLNGTSSCIKKKPELIGSLARKVYVEAMIEEYETITACLEKLLYSKKITRCAEKRQAILKKMQPFDTACVLHSRRTIKWLKEKYEINAIFPENKIYSTAGGIRMRSKSEAAIGNMLEALNIPYRYDSRININDAGAGLCPDFVILLPEGGTLIWEHLGLWDHPTKGAAYRAQTIEHFDAYRKLGYRIGLNLIYTFEADVQKPEILRQLISRHTGYETQ